MGGFGSSQFLKSKIKTRFPGPEVIQPTDAWAAVVKYVTIIEPWRACAISLTFY